MTDILSKTITFDPMRVMIPNLFQHEVVVVVVVMRLVIDHKVTARERAIALPLRVRLSQGFGKSFTSDTRNSVITVAHDAPGCNGRNQTSWHSLSRVPPMLGKVQEVRKEKKL